MSSSLDSASHPSQESVTKTIYLIRHAESEENRRLGSLHKVFSSLTRFTMPSSEDVTSSLELLNLYSQVDSEVSEKGKEQIQDMAIQLQNADFLAQHEIERIIHSPLQRARQTALGIFPEDRRNSRIEVTETDMLIEKTPSEWIPGNYATFLQRVAVWEDWLLQQPESRIAVVGHSQFFKAMLELDSKFANCDVWKVILTSAPVAQNSPSEPMIRTTPTRNVAWTNLEHLFACKLDAEKVADGESNSDS